MISTNSESPVVVVLRFVSSVRLVTDNFDHCTEPPILIRLYVNAQWKYGTRVSKGGYSLFEQQ